MRLDHLQRPELNKGTIDFAVSEEYWASHPSPRLNMLYHSLEPPPTQSRRPQPMKYVFAFDVSTEAIQSGFLATACTSLGRILFGGTGDDGLSLQPCFPANCRIAILSYNQALHYYNLSVRNFQFFRYEPTDGLMEATLRASSDDGTP